MKQKRLLELAGVQIDEAGGAAFVVAVDDEGFTNALVGPFTNGGVALAWVREMTKKGYHFDNPQDIYNNPLQKIEFEMPVRMALVKNMLTMAHYGSKQKIWCARP